MALAAVKTETAATDRPSQNDLVSVMVEGLFGFLLKGAKRLSQMAPGEMQRLKRLGVEFMEAPEHERPEILRTFVEVLLPEDHVGGVEESPRKDDPAVRAKLDDTRRYMGGQIKLYREKSGLTQIALARKAKIPQSHVCRLERGKHAPSRITIDRVAKALRIHPSLIDPSRPSPVEVE